MALPLPSRRRRASPARAASIAIAVTALGALSFAGCAQSGAATSPESTPPDDPIVFGVSGPLTGSQAQYGADWQKGFELALEQINADGGVDGRPVEIDFQDSQGEAAQATTIAQGFVGDEDVLAVLGDFSSATSMVASPIYQRAGLVQLGITNSHPDFTEAGDYIFSPAVTQAVEGQVVADGISAVGESAAVFHLNNDWGIAAADVVSGRLEDNGTAVVYSTAVEEASTDLQPLLIQAREAGADVLVGVTYYNTTSLLVQQAGQVGLGDVPWVVYGSNYSDEFLELAGDAADGVLTEATYFPDSERAATKDFVAAFTEKFDAAPNLFSAFAYDGLVQLAWAAENAEALTREGIRDTLRDGTDIPSAVFGPFAYNAERRIDNPTFTWLQVSDGAFVQVAAPGND